MSQRSSIMTHFRMLLIFISALFIVGILFGCLAAVFMPVEQKTDIMQNITHFFEERVNNGSTTYSLWEHSQQYLIIGVSIFILGLTVLGVPVVLLFIFMKGAILGFTVTFIISQMGSKGILFIIYSIIPQNLIIVPTLIFYIATSLAIALFIFNNRIMKYQGKLRPQLLSYTMIAVGINLSLLIVSFYESYIAPQLMDRAIALLPKSLLLFDLYSLPLL